MKQTETEANQISDKEEGSPKEQLKPCNSSRGKQSRFPSSKRVEFAAAVGLVVWVWSEMMETHDPLKLSVQWLIIVIFYVPVCYYISRWLNNNRLGYGIFIVLSLITAVFGYFNTFYPAFSIIPREQYVEMKTPRYFLLWNMNGREILSPINVIMLAQFTNLRDKAMTINSFQFEGRTTNNTWEIMPTIDVKMGRIVAFVGTNWGTSGMGVVLGPVKEGDVVTLDAGDDVFPQMLDRKMIFTGETVPGTFFLEGPKHGFDGTLRCRIRDSTDREFVESVCKPGTNYLRTTLRWGTGMGVGFPEAKDIRKLKVVRWSEEWR